jgi:hypothetical protein
VTYWRTPGFVDVLSVVRFIDNSLSVVGPLAYEINVEVVLNFVVFKKKLPKK